MTATAQRWLELNRDALARHVARVRQDLERARDGQPPRRRLEQQPPGEPAAVDLLADRLGISSFERDVLILCAAASLDDGVAGLCAAVAGGERAYPSFLLALSALPDGHWSAAVPAAPLRRWRLVEPEPGFQPARAPLEIDERILHHLLGIDYLDERLAPFMQRVAGFASLPPSRSALAERITEHLGAPATPAPLILLSGGAPGARQALAAAACGDDGRPLYALSSDALPDGAIDRASLRLLCERESILTDAAFLIECGDAPPGVASARDIELLRAPAIASSDEPLSLSGRAGLRLEVSPPTKSEQRDLWRAALAPQDLAQNGAVDRVVAEFDLEPESIDAAARAIADEPGADASERLWRACAVAGRPRLDDLVQRIEPMADWDDLVLPPAQRDALEQLTAHVRHRTTVYEDWGFAAKSARGLGISALFSGPSGTGKTMAGEVLARALSRDLYRIDLSSVVSKYIGETEKNLRRVFDAAEGTAAILLFDEADALFGSRSEVRDSHDRYANIEISYLLQRVESYRGLALLTTNLRHAVDPAFLRRFRFVVEFPFPDLDARAEIWRRVFPAAVPLDGLDVDRFARLDVTGGHIRNIALGAAFLAAEDGGPVTATHLERAVRHEYAKMERPLPELEARAWT